MKHVIYNMAPKIGITTKPFNPKNWYKEIGESGFKVLEIGKRTAKFYLDPEWINKLKPYLEGFDLSLHSGTIKVFTENPQFTITELNMLKSEVLICEMIGAKELIFHLKHDKLTEDEISRLREVIDFAKEHNIEMIYESNGIIVADVVYDFLERFPDVNYNLDLGHMNNGYGRGMLGCEIDEFINKIKDRVVYIHAHNNSGKKDEYKALRDGTLDWKHVLSLLNLSIVKKIMIEIADFDDIIKTKTDLKEYFNPKTQ